METKELARKAVNTVTNGKTGRSEGQTAKAIESQTSKLPSDLFLWAGLGCLGVSVITGMFGLRGVSRVIGQFASPILIMGLYNKLVKVEGSDESYEGLIF